MQLTKLRNLVFVLALSLVGFACGDSSTGNGNQSDPATVEGRVENNSSQKAVSGGIQDIEGAVVTAAYVKSDGSLETLGSSQAETNAQGEFTLQIKAEALANANASDRIVILAEKNGTTAKAFVTSRLESGSSVTIQPITYESTAETEVYQESHSNGDSETVTKAEIEASVTAEVAADIEGSASSASTIASSIAAAAEARAEYYSEAGVEFTTEMQEEVAQIKADAMVELENRLYAASSAEEEQAAIDAFTETVANAYVDAGVEASAAAKASQMYAEVMVEQSASVSSDAQASLRKRLHAMSTFALEAAVEAQMQATGASETAVTNATEAAVSLRSDIKALTTGTQSEVESAFASFNSEIEAIVESEFTVNGSVFADTNAEINEQNGIKATFESALDAAISLGAVVDAYTTFYSEVSALVESNFTEASSAEAEAFTQLLILINTSN